MRAHVFHRSSASSLPAGRMASAFSYQVIASRNHSYATNSDPRPPCWSLAPARRSAMIPARQMLSACAGSLRSRYRSAFSSALGIASWVSGLSSKITPAPLVLRDGPQEVGGHDGPRERGSIAEDDDERGQVLDLKTVVERVAKAMGPVKERQRDEDEEVETS